MADLTISDSYMSLAFEKAAGELGQKAQMLVTVENKIEFEGEASVQLLGLPANTSTVAEPMKITKDTADLLFPITINETAKPGTYKSLVCRVIVTENGEPVTHTLGTGELRVDKPLPPKVAAPQAAPKPKPAATAPAEPAPKRLTRLEQLRLEKMKQQENE
jgi:hypothetical protein